MCLTSCHNHCLHTYVPNVLWLHYNVFCHAFILLSVWLLPAFSTVVRRFFLYISVSLLFCGFCMSLCCSFRPFKVTYRVVFWLVLSMSHRNVSMDETVIILLLFLPIQSFIVWSDLYSVRAQPSSHQFPPRLLCSAQNGNDCDVKPHPRQLHSYFHCAKSCWLLTVRCRQIND